MDVRRIVVGGALLVMVCTVVAAFVAAQPAMIIEPDPGVLAAIGSIASGAGGGGVTVPAPYDVPAGSPWLWLVFGPMLLAAAVLCLRPRVTGAVMWSLASLGIGALLLVLRTVAPFGLPSHTTTTALWPATALPIALAAIFAAHAALLVALALASRRRPRRASDLPRATLARR